MPRVMGIAFDERSGGINELYMPGILLTRLAVAGSHTDQGLSLADDSVFSLEHDMDLVVHAGGADFSDLGNTLPSDHLSNHFDLLLG